MENVSSAKIITCLTTKRTNVELRVRKSHVQRVKLSCQMVSASLVEKITQCQMTTNNACLKRHALPISIKIDTEIAKHALPTPE